MKFVELIKHYIKISLMYRFKIFSKFFTQVFHLMMVIFLWKSVYVAVENVGDYTEQQMISYVYISTFVSVIFNIGITFRKSNHIKDGTLSHYLIRPIKYNVDLFSFYISTIFIDIIILTSVLLFLNTFGFIEIINPKFLDMIYVFLSIILFYYFTKVIANLAFWVVHMWPLKPLYNSFYLLLAGGYFPLDILPNSIYNFLKYTPFSLFGFTNVMIIQGKLIDKTNYFIAILFWIFLFYLLDKILWRKGLNKYESVGL